MVLNLPPTHRLSRQSLMRCLLTFKCLNLIVLYITGTDLKHDIDFSIPFMSNKYYHGGYWKCAKNTTVSWSSRASSQRLKASWRRGRKWPPAEGWRTLHPRLKIGCWKPWRILNNSGSRKTTLVSVWSLSQEQRSTWGQGGSGEAAVQVRGHVARKMGLQFVDHCLLVVLVQDAPQKVNHSITRAIQ